MFIATSRRGFRPFALALFAALALDGCALFQSPAPPAPPPAPAKPSYDLVAAIRAAGRAESSVINVTPLRDPGVTALANAAAADDAAGRYQDEAAKLDQALKLSPDAPDLLQARAEAAVRLKDYAQAEQLAHRSWELGPRLGPLCARNWQTIVEMRLQANDNAGAAAARKMLKTCHKPDINRY